MCGSTSPAASECLSNLTRCVNALLAGKLDSRLAAWFCGAPLTALVKGSGAFHPIAVGETLRRLVSKVCCVSVRDSLPSLLLPHGQVGIDIRNGLEAAVHSLRTILATAGSNCELCCLKVAMTNAFNECSRDSFLSRCRLISQNCLAGCSGLTAALGNYVLAPTGLHPQLAYSRVIPLDHYSLLISYTVLLSQLDWLFSYGTWMTELWWVRAPALPPFANACTVWFEFWSLP